MLIKKGQLLLIKHIRKGTFIACANEDFDTCKDEWHLFKGTEHIDGITHFLKPDETISCRKDLCTVKILKDHNGT